MSQFLVINKVEERRTVKIRNSDTGAVDEIFLQPKSRAKLPDGFSVDPEWLRNNSATVVVHALPSAN